MRVRRLRSDMFDVADDSSGGVVVIKSLRYYGVHVLVHALCNKMNVVADVGLIFSFLRRGKVS